jgi:TM2 domain-containing membrane protein YozV
VKINVILGLTAFVITFLVSRVNNIINTSLFRSGIGFLVFFLIGYILRFVLYQIQIKKVPDITTDQPTQEMQSNFD